jgi:hypothetical protein
MGKRANGEGSVYNGIRSGHSDRWVGAVDLGYVGGKRRRSDRVTPRPSAEALDKLRKLQQQVDRGLRRRRRSTTLEGVARDVARHARRRPGRRRPAPPSTQCPTGQHVDQHLDPVLGRVKLAKLARSTSGSSTRTLRQGAVARPPSAGSTRRSARRCPTRWPTSWCPQRREGRPATVGTPARGRAAHARPGPRRLLAAVRGTRHEAAYVLMLTVGLRLGEVLGLRWSDVDLDGGELRVRRQLRRVGGQLTFTEPKSKRSRRTVSLPASPSTRSPGTGRRRRSPPLTGSCSPRRSAHRWSRRTCSGTGTGLRDRARPRRGAAPRPAPLRGVAHARRRGPDAGRDGDARALVDRAHGRHLQPRPGRGPPRRRDPDGRRLGPLKADTVAYTVGSHGFGSRIRPYSARQDSNLRPSD